MKGCVTDKYKHSFLHIFDSYGFCFSFIALVKRIPPTRACDSQRNREALYSPFVPLQYNDCTPTQQETNGSRFTIGTKKSSTHPHRTLDNEGNVSRIDRVDHNDYF